jgi:hypothetical protein
MVRSYFLHAKLLHILNPGEVHSQIIISDHDVHVHMYGQPDNDSISGLSQALAFPDHEQSRRNTL